MGLSLVWIIISWLLGVATGLAWELPLVFLGAGFALILILSLVSWLNWQETNVKGMAGQERKQKIALGLIILLSFLAGSFWSTVFQLGEQPVLVHRSGEQVELVGQVVSSPRNYPNREVFLLRATGVKEEAKWRTINELVEVVQYSYGDQQQQRGGNQVAYGQQLQLTGQVRLPSGASNPGEFDYSQYLANQRIYSQMVLSGEPVILTAGSKFSPFNLAIGYKEKSIQVIKKHLPEREGNILAAMTFGWRDGLTEEDKDLYINGGLYHLFAVSGLHMGFLLVAGVWLTGKLKLAKIPAVLTVALLVSFYVMMADFSVSALRAAMMGMLGLIALLWQREKSVYIALALAAFILTLVNPYYPLQVGFQLSFVATWGIVFFYPALESLVTKLLSKWKQKGQMGQQSMVPGIQVQLPWWIKLIIVPVAAQIALLPLLAHYFNVVSLLGIITNSLTVWLVAGVVLTGLLILPIATLITPLGEILLIAFGGSIFLLTWLLELLTKAPGAFFIIKTPSITAIILYYALTIYLACWVTGSLEKLARPWFRWHYPKVSKVVGIFLLILLLVAWVNPGAAKQLTITVLDVGQGDAIVITMPNGKNLMIDGGGIPGRPGANSFDVGEQIVVPYLQRQGIKQIDLIVNTHGHYDHVAGLIPVLENLQVSKALISPVPATSETYLRFITLLEEQNIPVEVAKSGQFILLDPDVKLVVLHPGEPISGTPSELNDNSVVIKLIYGQFSMLFSGDIERAAMMELVTQEANLAVGLDSVIYKVAHHGSSTGLIQEFLERVNPQVSVIPVGNNSFGHPAESLIDFLTDRGVIIYRTDLDGGITITTNGKRAKIITTK